MDLAGAYELEVMLPGRGSSVQPLPGGELLTIGRGPECSITLDDQLVSRRHALLRVEEDGLHV